MGKINVYNKIVIENQKKIKYGIQSKFCTNIHLKVGLSAEFTAC